MKNGDCARQCCVDRHEVVKRRWRVLAEALFANQSSCGRPTPNPYNSVEKLNFFQLFSVDPQDSPYPAEENASWYRYELKLDGTRRSVSIRHPSSAFTIDQLIGFNNTGNVRVWPSEEVLAYLAMKNETFFARKTVLEVGGGMSCLAGVFLAQYAGCQLVHLTDGNPRAVQNVTKILQANDPFCEFGCEVLLWSEYQKHERTYDVILSADCVFFDEYRADLLHLMEGLLRPDGVVLLVAPRRGGSLQKFVNEARASGFVCSMHSCYDPLVWSRHGELKAQPQFGYDEDVHFPLLVVMTRPSDRTKANASGWWLV